MSQTYQSIVIEAPIERVWAKLRNFHDLSWAPDVIEKCEPLGEKGEDQIGARRVLNGVFYETLLELNELGHTMKYSIDDGPSPVSKDEVANYIGVIHAEPVTETGGTFVSWSSIWEAKDAKAEAFCHGIYVALLRSLKQACG